jgi:flagellar motility protein MotE (MotC chaperone)
MARKKLLDELREQLEAQSFQLEEAKFDVELGKENFELMRAKLQSQIEFLTEDRRKMRNFIVRKFYVFLHAHGQTNDRRFAELVKDFAQFFGQVEPWSW